MSGRLMRCLRRHLAVVLCIAVSLLAAPHVLADEQTGPASFVLVMRNVEDGLPHNLPLGFAQDARGRIWISTHEGMVRFNGHDFLVYDRMNANDLDLAGATALLAEDNGDLLVGNGHGVFLYSADRWRLLDPRLEGVRTEHLFRGHDGVLRIVSGNRLLSLHADGRLETLSLGEALVQVFAIVQRPDGALLLGAETGLYVVNEGRVRPHPVNAAFGGKAVLHISPDGAGWLLSTVLGVWQLDGNGALHPLKWRDRHDRALRTTEGGLWLGRHDGALVYADAQGKVSDMPIPGTRARSIMLDSDGALWAGSTAGVVRIAMVAAGELPGSEGYPRVVMEDSHGVVWAGFTEGLRRINGRERQNVLASSVMALALPRDGNGVWAGTYRDGVVRVDAQGRELQRIPVGGGRTSSMVVALHEAHDGSVWIGTASMGLQRWKAGHFQAFDENVGLPMRHIQVIHPDGSGGVWVGGTAGLGHVDINGNVRYWAPLQDLPAASIHDFLSDADGTLWMASDRGLLRYREGRFVVFGLEQGLPRERIFRILPDGDQLWLSSARGVFRVHRAELKRVADGQLARLSVDVVDQTDGLPGGQGNGGSWPAGWRTRDGRLLFPVSEGVAEIEPRRLDGRRLRAVPVEIETVLVDGATAAPEERLITGASTRRLEIHFNGLSYQTPERVRYRYRLVGFDEEWYESGRTGRAAFTDLPAGDYRFEVEAMSLPVDWDDRSRVGSTALDVTVKAPLWQHPLVIVLGMGSGLVLVYGLMWLRMSRYRRRQKRLNQIIEERTDELVEKNFALEAAGRERDALVQKLAHQATHDALTELPNRRAADGHLRAVMHRAAKTGQAVAVALIDLDHFKRINDTYGHEAGDRVLCEVGQRLRGMSGSDVFAARHGGEEFLMVMQGWPSGQVRQWLDKLREELAREPIELGDDASLRCTISGGVAFLYEDGQSASDLLAAADANLYQAKREGRNRIVG